MSKLKGKNIFFTSDLHFGHSKCIEYSCRPFKTVEEMNEKLIRNWNSVVKDNDLVYVLGDFFMYLSKDELREITSKLKGTKICVRGNHDMSPNEMINIGFAACVESAEIVIAGERVLLSHYPYKRPWYFTVFYDILHKINSKKFFKPRKFVRQLEDRGLWLLHGHVHSTRKLYVPGKKMIHIGVDAWDYKPVPLQRVGDMIEKIRRGQYQE